MAGGNLEGDRIEKDKKQYTPPFQKFLNPDKGLMEIINAYKSNRGREIVDSCINLKCYVCEGEYTGRASFRLCPDCIKLLESRFSHLLH